MQSSMKEIQKDLTKKIILQRGVHGYYERRTQINANFFKTANIILPALIALLALLDFAFISEYISWLTDELAIVFIGILGFVLFILGILFEVFDIGSKPVEHRKAIEQYSILLRTIRNIDLESMTPELQQMTLDGFNQSYLNIASTTIRFTDRQFSIGETNFIRHQAIRRARKENPFAWPWQIRALAKQKVKELEFLTPYFADETDN